MLSGAKHLGRRDANSSSARQEAYLVRDSLENFYGGQEMLRLIALILIIVILVIILVRLL
jgi:hypothetical protein